MYEQLKGVRASGHLGGRPAHPRIPLFITYCADYLASNNAKHNTKTKNHRTQPLTELDPNCLVANK